MGDCRRETASVASADATKKSYLRLFLVFSLHTSVPTNSSSGAESLRGMGLIDEVEFRHIRKMYDTGNRVAHGVTMSHEQG
jgi:hypothetical protein